MENGSLNKSPYKTKPTTKENVNTGILKQGLKNLFPIWFLLTASFPFILTLFFCIDLVMWRQASIISVWILVFTSLGLLFQTRFFPRLGVIIFTLFGFFEVSNLAILHSPINVISVLALLNTNTSEAFEFLEIKGFINLTLLIPFLFFAVKAFWTKYSYTNDKKTYPTIALVIALVFIGENLVNNRLIRKGSPHFIKTVAAVAENIEALNNDTNHSLRAVKAKNLSGQVPKTIVLVLGESLSRRHMGLYGHSRETNPRLSSLSKLIVFEDVVSPYSNTISAVTKSLANINADSHDTLQPQSDILDVMSASGFKTYWISNQRPIGLWENYITQIAKKADFTKFVNTSGNSSRESNYIRSYDEKVVSPFEEVLSDTAISKFIVIHLMGNHTSYRRRYPEEYKKWEENGEVPGTKAQYDNSVLYNDYIIHRIISELDRGSSSNDALIYLSDHGENVYDELGNCGHDYGSILPKSNVEIPFIIWTSEEYQNSFPTKVHNASSHRNAPYMSDDLFHTLLDLCDVESEHYDSTRSILSPTYDSTRLRILENGSNYDTYSY